MAAATLAAQQTFPFDDYTLTDLGTLGGSESSAAGVNVYGEVTGTSTTATGARHAFRYGNGQMVDLGSRGRSLAHPARRSGGRLAWASAPSST